MSGALRHGGGSGWSWLAPLFVAAAWACHGPAGAPQSSSPSTDQACAGLEVALPRPPTASADARIWLEGAQRARAAGRAGLAAAWGRAALALARLEPAPTQERIAAQAEALKTQTPVAVTAGGAGAPRRARRVESALARATRAVREGRYDEACALLQPLAGDSGGDGRLGRLLAVAWLGRARVLLRNAAGETQQAQRLRAALASLWAAVDAHPVARTEAVCREIARLERRLALLESAVGRAQAEREALARAFAAAPDDPAVLLELARAWERTGDATAAARWLDLLERTAPASAQAGFVRLRRALDQLDAAQARARIDEFGSAYPEAGRLAAQLRRMVAERSSARAAEQAARAALELERLNAEVQQLRRQLAERVGAGGANEAEGAREGAPQPVSERGR